MAENESKLVNFRAGTAVQEQISALMKRWDCKQSAAILRAIDEAVNGKGLAVSEGVGVAQKTYERAGRIENIVEEVLELVQSSSAAAPVVQDSVESAEPPGDAPFHPTCKHCGTSFGAWNRFASICPGCKALGHVGDSRECSVCFENRGGL